MLWNAYTYGTVLVWVSLATHSTLPDHRNTIKPVVSDLLPFSTTRTNGCSICVCMFFDNIMDTAS